MLVGAGSRPILQIKTVNLHAFPCYSSTDVTATAARISPLVLTQQSKQRPCAGTGTLAAACSKGFPPPKAFHGCFPSISFTFKSSARSGCKALRYGEIFERGTSCEKALKHFATGRRKKLRISEVSVQGKRHRHFSGKFRERFPTGAGRKGTRCPLCQGGFEEKNPKQTKHKKNQPKAKRPKHPKVSHTG